MKEYIVKTSSRTEMIDIGHLVEDAVRYSGVENGVCTVFVPHTTAAVTINENADPSVRRDLMMELNKIVPYTDNYAHREGNSAAHIKSTLVGCSLSVIVQSGKLQMGTWQSVFLCEFDGPRSRKVWVYIGAGG